MTAKNTLTITTHVASDLKTVWQIWTQTEHIKKWNAASPDWHTTKAENALKKGGKFSSRMEAKDGSMGFDFGGTYNEVTPHSYIAYTLDDGRKVHITFAEINNGVSITEVFEPETTHPVEMQQKGWQGILDNFKKYVESM